MPVNYTKRPASSLNASATREALATDVSSNDGAKTGSEVSCMVAFDLVGMGRYAYTLSTMLVIAGSRNTGWNLT